jgi:hypothetical protein
MWVDGRETNSKANIKKTLSRNEIILLLLLLLLLVERTGAELAKRSGDQSPKHHSVIRELLNTLAIFYFYGAQATGTLT